MRKILALFVMCLSLCSILSGCYDASEIDDYSYAIVLGIDKGTQEKAKVTVQVPTITETGVQSGGSQGTSQTSSSGYTILSVEAPSILGGLNMLNTSLPRIISLKHLKAFIISEEIARQGLGDVINFAMYRDLRRPIPIYISKAGAQNFISENKTVIGTNISKTMEFLNEQGHNTGFHESFTNMDFYRYLKSPFIQASAILAGLSKDDGQITGDPTHIVSEKAGNTILKDQTKRNIMGTAVFRGDKMVGELDGDETRVFLMIINEFKKANMDIPDPKDPQSLINFDVRMGKKPKIQTRIENGIPYVHLTLDIEANINAIRTNINYPDPSLLPIAQNALKEYIQEILDQTIKKCQYEYKSDIFGFGNYVAQDFLTIQEWEEYNWLDKFSDSKISTTVNTHIRGTGLLVRLSPIKKGD